MDEAASPLVTTEWLERHLDAPDVRVVDASWYLPQMQRNARAEYEREHIPGAVFFDIDEICDLDSPYPHMLPSPEKFSSRVRNMGLGDGNCVIVYDGAGLFSAARVWWMFRVMGIFQVYVLDGGFDRWKAAGRPVTAEQTKIAPNIFHVDFDASRVATLDEMKEIVATGESQIADARPAGRFTGEDPEPRAGVRGGHMPGAMSLPASTLSKDGMLLPPEELKKRFEEAGIDLSKPVVTSCGSGITAAVITLALETLGHSANRLYDGSWTEWGGRSDTPVVKGK